MSQYTVTMSFSNTRTRILVTDGADELMRAALPTAKHVRHPRAAQMLLEGLALWLDRPVRVALSADDLDGTSFFGLTDDFGCPQPSVYYSVEIVERPVRRRPRKVGGVGDFRDLRQLSLLGGERR